MFIMLFYVYVCIKKAIKSYNFKHFKRIKKVWTGNSKKIPQIHMDEKTKGFIIGKLFFKMVRREVT